jgi:hypothetical protein
MPKILIVAQLAMRFLFANLGASGNGFSGECFA